MKNKNIKNKNNNKSKKLQRPHELSPNVLATPSAYMDKIFQCARGQDDTYSIVTIYDATATTDVSGQLSTIFANNPTGYANWTSLAAVFDEYRVLGMDLTFEPYQFNGALITQAPIVAVNDYDSSAALSGYVLAAQYSSYEEHAGGRAWTKRILMSGAENAAFLGTASPTSTFWIKIWSAGNSVSTNIGRYSLKTVIQFRGKGI